MCLEFEFLVIGICLGFGAWNLGFIHLAADQSALSHMARRSVP